MAEQFLDKEDRAEPSGVATRPVLFTACAILGFVGFSLAGGRAFYDWQVRGPVNISQSAFPVPALQLDEAADLAAFENEQRAKLQGYAWVDRQNGLISIPIETAMALVVSKGVHGYDPVGLVAADHSPQGTPP